MLKYVGMCPKCCFPVSQSSHLHHENLVTACYCYSSDYEHSNKAVSLYLICRMGWSRPRVPQSRFWLLLAPILTQTHEEKRWKTYFSKYRYLFQMRKVVPRNEMCNVGCRERCNSKSTWHVIFGAQSNKGHSNKSSPPIWSTLKQ